MVGIEKACSSCKQVKDLSEFCKKASAKDGYAYNCKTCNSERSIKWKIEHPERVKELDRARAEKNKDKERERSRRRRLEDPEYHRACSRKSRRKHAITHNKKCMEWARLNNPRRMKEDPAFKLKVNLRIRLSNFLGKKPKRGSAVRDMGCTGQYLADYLESLWTEGMSWETYGRGRGKWTIDHIMPLGVFNLEDRQHFLLASHYLNLQPMWHDENTRKSNKIPYELLQAA